MNSIRGRYMSGCLSAHLKYFGEIKHACRCICANCSALAGLGLPRIVRLSPLTHVSNGPLSRGDIHAEALIRSGTHATPVDIAKRDDILWRPRRVYLSTS